MFFLNRECPSGVKTSFEDTIYVLERSNTTLECSLLSYNDSRVAFVNWTGPGVTNGQVCFILNYFIEFVSVFFLDFVEFFF